jgi:hypothetical protein
VSFVVSGCESDFAGGQSAMRVLWAQKPLFGWPNQKTLTCPEVAAWKALTVDLY